MSEFSESYHLKTDDPAEAVALLGRAGLKGFVFPPTNGWVTFLAQDNKFQPDERVIRANEGFLLHYVSAEDHCWGFAFFEGAQKVCDYSCAWDEDISIEDGGYVPAVLGTVLDEHGVMALDEFEPLLRPASFEGYFALEAPLQFANALELEHFEWLSFHYIARDRQRDPGSHPEIQSVG